MENLNIMKLLASSTIQANRAQAMSFVRGRGKPNLLAVDRW
jgi:hypothetical protein